jgi:membrane protein implicated in regulation of membrane protease activity
MTALFLICFIAGLLLAVRMMLVGVEREAKSGSAAKRRVRMWLPSLVAFITVFGVAGYLLSRSPMRAIGAATALAALIGAAAAVVSVWLVARWSKVVPEHDVDDPRYILQGHLARVVTSIGERGRDGEITFELEREHRRLRARSIDEEPVDAGTDVVIERIEDGIAYVEPWVQVEQRL